uniref:t-SNARE coiled-coil homology domain-containing protein n=1 Tax=Oryza punctata TaxID=4537 RepID=A0A0E0L9H6_ORYPU
MEAGVLQPAAPPAQEVERGVFQVNTKVEALRYMADALGTPRDTPSLRGRLRGTRAGIKRLATSTSQSLRQAAAAAVSSADDDSVASCSKLAMDFEAAVNEYQKIERRIAAVERQETTASARRSPQSSSPPPSFNHRNNNGDQTFSEQKQTQLAVLQKQQRDITLLDNEIELQEAIIAEREQGILEVQQEIADIHDIFKDLAVLVHDQGECIEIVTTNIDRAEAATSQAEVQISKAAGIRGEEKEKLLTGAGSEENSSTKFLLLAVLGLFLFIVGLVLIA